MASTSTPPQWAAKYPELGTDPLPVEPNISPEYFERERERIFKHTWLNVGRVNEIPRAGDYFVREIETLKTSIVVVRGKDGVVRGFHNVCKHRGNKLASGSGCARSFVCGFHGWTYDLAGRLVLVPDEEQFFDFEKSAYGLTPVATDVWEGFIFINVDPHPTETLEQWMSELYEQYRGYTLDTMTEVARYLATVNTNWKVFMDITQESYHVPCLHKRIVPDSNTSKGNPFCHLPSIRIFQRHRASSIYANPEHQPTPAEAVAYKYGTTVLEGVTASDPLHKCLNPEGVSNWAFDSNVIFPNLIFHVGKGWYITYNFWPLAVDRTLMEYRFYMTQANSAGEKISQEFSKVLARDLLREDLSTLEAVQAGLFSGALTHMPLSDQEIMLRHSYKVVEDFVRSNK
ncbi:aromatic ring-hydroxylating dioxygenase subunit alpha [soil metagenome]